MHTQAFSTSDAIQRCWAVVKREPSVFLGLVILQATAMSLQTSTGHASGGALASLVGHAASVALAIGAWRIALRALDDKPVSLAALTELTWTEALRYFVTSVMLGVVVVVGLVLLIVPGVVWGLRFALAPLVVVSEGREPLDAMRRSHELTEGALAEMLVFVVSLIGMNLLGALALGLGLVLTVPISFVAMAHAYRTLSTREWIMHTPRATLGQPLAVTQ